MFWGLILKANKRYSQVVTKAFHVSHATLDVQDTASNDGDVVQVWVNTDDTNHLLCNLEKKTSHVPLDLAFSEGETIAFFSKGTGTVHLTGFLLPEEPDYDLGGFGEEGEEDVSDEEDEEEALQNKSLSKNQKAKQIKVSANKQDSDNDDEEDDDDDDEDELDDDDDDDDEDEDDSDDDEDDDDSDDDDEEEEATSPPAKIAKLDKAGKLDKAAKLEKVANQKQNGLSNGKAPKEQQNKKEQKQNQQEKQKKGQQQQQEKQKPVAKTLSGGVTVEELRPGKGAEAKAGKKVQVYYEGRLKSNNKVFDSTKGGEGFKFILGHGEVIRGWDIGVAGMKVGSKRRITCPPNVAYGAKGSPPVIPPNATLVFDVELRGVN